MPDERCSQFGFCRPLQNLWHYVRSFEEGVQMGLLKMAACAFFTPKKDILAKSKGSLVGCLYNAHKLTDLAWKKMDQSVSTLCNHDLISGRFAVYFEYSSVSFFLKRGDSEFLSGFRIHLFLNWPFLFLILGRLFGKSSSDQACVSFKQLLRETDKGRIPATTAEFCS